MTEETPAPFRYTPEMNPTMLALIEDAKRGPYWEPTPRRIQRKQTKGWRMPERAVFVGRPTKWGNPFQVGPFDRADAVARYRDLAQGFAGVVRDELAGRDLVCWCPLDKPCHADVLLEIANAPSLVESQEQPNG